jgi:DNA repair exonuclease SbcCD ATPase subunit
LHDVEQFVQIYFQTSEIKELPLHVLREEIKFLQLLAKILTLNTQAFTATRQKLSECWDKIKTQEKDRKKEIVQKREAYRQNFDLVIERINVFAEECRAPEMTLQTCNARASEISEYMRSVELGRDEVKALKDELFKAKKIILDREQEKEEQRSLKEKEIELKRREKIHALKEELSSLIAHIAEIDMDQLHTKREEIAKEFDQLGLNKIEKQMIDRMFKQLKDAIAEKKERAVMALSEDDLKSLEQLKVLVKERIDRRFEIKAQLEHYRKALGGSGFDFEKAMMYREMIEAEKLSLEKIDSAIEELELKIEEIEG